MKTKVTSADLSTVVERAMDVLSVNLNSIKIGKIESFDKSTQTANVRIVIKRLIEESSQGVKTYREFPILLEVPCIIISGGGSYLEMPIKVGDSCLLLFSDEDIDNWMVTNENTPASTKRHDLSDAVCLVGLNNLTSPFIDFEGDKIKLQFIAGVSLIMDDSGSKIVGDLNVDGDAIVTGDIEVDGNIIVAEDITSDGEIAGTTLKALNGFTGAAAPTNTLTIVNGIVVGVA